MNMRHFIRRLRRADLTDEQRRRRLRRAIRDRPGSDWASALFDEQDRARREGLDAERGRLRRLAQTELPEAEQTDEDVEEGNRG